MLRNHRKLSKPWASSLTLALDKSNLGYLPKQANPKDGRVPEKIVLCY